jgi:hypothetical protein
MVLKLRKIGRKYLESFGTRCWRSMEKIIGTDRVRNEVESRRKGISYKQYEEERPTELVT